MSRDINATFCSELLKLAHAEVKRHFPQLNLKTAAWVWSGDRRNWEFHGPEGFYWNGRAHNATEARAKGWERYLESKGLGEEATP